ncbi:MULTISPECIES: hypothetical protein [Rhodomicrobium]|uniref:hypothetical protein n=1 Tax=Rhodomicrobium TaxID=1068 RepID=UPI001482C4EE|nr:MULTISPECIES: hypothetical protein [Rhodomicrobium]
MTNLIRSALIALAIAGAATTAASAASRHHVNSHHYTATDAKTFFAEQQANGN